MKYLITRKAKKLTKDYNNKRLEIVIPKNQMIEIAYKAFPEKDRNKQIVGAYVYLKMGESVFPSIVEFSRDEVEIIGDSISKEELCKEATLKGKLFFINKGISTCTDFIRQIQGNPTDSFTIIHDDENILKVVYGSKKSERGKQVFTVAF